MASNSRSSEPFRSHLTTGRPRAELNVEELEKLAAMQCTWEEIAEWFQINRSTLADHIRRDPDIRDALNRGAARGRISIRRQLFEHSKTNVAATIFLAKNVLGYRDMGDSRPEADAELAAAVDMDPVKRRARIDELTKMLEARREEKARTVETTAETVDPTAETVVETNEPPAFGSNGK